MKLTAVIVSYNEGIFIDYVIKSLIDFVDEIVFIDEGMQAAIEAGYGTRSTDGTTKIIDHYLANEKCLLAPIRKNSPKTFKDLVNPAFNIVKQRKADWWLLVCGDEIWTPESLRPMKTILKNCDRNGIMALNVWMNIFAPDFWHYKDFRNPRLAKITEDVELISGDAVYWPQRKLWQYAGNTTEPYPPGTPPEVIKINSDYPRMLRPFHYSCVGEKRVKFKVDFYKKYNNSYGDCYNEAFIKKNWKAFENMGYRSFTGKHPKIMLNHPLYDERLL